MVWPTGAAASAVVVNKTIVNTRSKVLAAMIFLLSFGAGLVGEEQTWEANLGFDPCYPWLKNW
jgi:hypothetical protein